ncbi:MAG: hypothetical protein KC731_32290, partial [Myxococcales bacterium]|nr:hypothetical protein [Myxococcales bacterium]
QLRQVMMNLLQNAAQAMKQDGRIHVQTRPRFAPTRRGGARGQRSDPELITISVRDAGPGIPPAALERIFLPFYTTKDEGTGLGLAICQRIVQSAGGRIEVRSRVGEGTTFDVVLPAAMHALGATPVAPDVERAEEPNGDTSGETSGETSRVEAADPSLLAALDGSGAPN